MFGFQVSVWVVPEVFQGAHCLAYFGYAVVDVVLVVHEIEGYVCTQVFEVCSEVNEGVVVEVDSIGFW